MRNSLFAVVLLGGVAAVAVWSAGVFFGRSGEIQALRDAIDEAWVEVDALIDRRLELIPDLAKTAGGSQESNGLSSERLVDAARRLEAAIGRIDRIDRNDELDEALSRLLAVADRRSGVASDPVFLALRDELAAIETEMTIERRRYNQAVHDYNTFIQLFPNTLVAEIHGYEREPAYFRTSEESRQGPPPVSFSDPQPEVRPEPVR